MENVFILFLARQS